MHILYNGDSTTVAAVKAAFEAGQCVLVHGRADNHTSTGLMLDGRHFDTRGQCYSMWDEAWTTAPADLRAALFAAHYAP